jgi:hypothetical protein
VAFGYHQFISLVALQEGIQAASTVPIVENVLGKLNYANADGQIVVDASQLQFAILNPAINAQHALYHEPHAVYLVVGTLQPIHVMIQELVTNLATDAQQVQQQLC